MAYVLIVEDDADTREFMEMLVSSSGYETMTATHGQEALARMKERRPCVVLLDLMMPVMDGWQFREHQLGDAAIADVPVVAVSALPQPAAVIRERLQAPVVKKPVAIPALLEEISRACGRPAISWDSPD